MYPHPPRLSYLSLDLWRGIASLIVVVYHTAGVHGLHHPILKTTPLFHAASFGWLGVQLFFVISGFCIANAATISLARDPGVSSFFIARLRRIFPPYWCALFLFLSVVWLSSFLVEKGVLGTNGLVENIPRLLGINSILLNVTLTQVLATWGSILPVSWTLCYELAFYILVGLALAAVGRRLGSRAMLRMLHLLTFLCIGWQLILGGEGFYPFNLWPHFGLGVLVYDILAFPKEREPHYWAAAILVAEVCLISLREYPLAGQSLRLSSIVALVFAAVLIGLHRFDEVVSKHKALAGLTWIGGFSYSLYLTHHYILRIVLQLFEKLHLPDPGGVVGLMVGVFGSIFCAVVFFRFCEKPFLKKRPNKLSK